MKEEKKESLIDTVIEIVEEELTRPFPQPIKEMDEIVKRIKSLEENIKKLPCTHIYMVSNWDIEIKGKHIPGNITGSVNQKATQLTCSLCLETKEI